jgi:NADH dehydrogenase
LTFVVVGAGPTGVELAGALVEIANRTLSPDFRRIDPRKTRVVLVEGGPKVLGSFADPLTERAREALAAIGVEVRLGQAVTVVDDDGVVVGGERLRAATVLWAAGNAASPLGARLGVPLDRAGRVVVGPDLSVPGRPEVFVIGDQAHVDVEGVGTVPGVAPAALQMGAHVASAIRADLAGSSRPTFRYADRGSMATIGTRKAVAQVGRLRFSGLVAWLLWVFVHLMTLVTFRNRVVVFVKWTWAWLTFDRSSRLVTATTDDRDARGPRRTPPAASGA